MGRAHGPKRAFEKCAQLLDSMAELQTHQRKRTGHVAHVVARSGQHLHPAGGQVLGRGLREIASIAHDDPVLHPPGKRITEGTIIGRGSGEIKAAQASRFITLHAELTASPPAHAGLRRARPGPKGAICWRTRAT
jgi:hypothetical protein